jgi:AcrR family transcriptional regulator
MADIAAESGLSKGTLCWYFDSKHNLCQAALTAVMEEVAERASEVLAACDTATQRLRVGARCLVDVCREIEGYFGLVVEFWTQSERREEVTAFWDEMITQYRQVVEAILEAGVASGEFEPVDAEALAWMIMAAYDGLAAYHMMMPDIDIDRVSEGFIEALMKGVRASDESE